jgi:histidinol-phosphate phosphatase family protein
MTKFSVVLLAGGFGTRLQSIIKKPKPLVKINNVSIIIDQLNIIKENGFTDVLILVHHQKDKIIRYVLKNKPSGINIKFHTEIIPRGTAGAVFDIITLLKKNFILIYSDIFFRANLKRFLNFHIKNKSDITPFIHPNNHPYDSDIVIVENGVIKKIFKYPHLKNFYANNLVMSGIFICSIDIFKQLPSNDTAKFDLTKDLLIPSLNNNKYKVCGYKSTEYLKDMGTPKRLAEVKNDILKNKHNLLKLDNPRAAIFFDRDGTILESCGYLVDINQIKFVKNLPESIKKINTNNDLAIMVTNQPQIAQGRLTFQKLKKIHDYIEFNLGLSGSIIDDIYFCPHHPDKGFEREVVDLKIKCKCRKPNIKLINDAARNNNIALDQSWFIGDSWRDMDLARRVGLRSIFIKTKDFFKCEDLLPQADFYFDSFYEAIDFIYDYFPKITKKLNSLLPENPQKYLFISGVSQSGKSTLSSVLRLQNQSLKYISLSFDGFLNDSHDINGFKNKYNVNKIINALHKIKSNQKLRWPIYDRKKRKAISYIILDPKQYNHFIFDGNFSLNPDLLAILKPFKIHLTIDESERKKRFYREYKHRGLSDIKIKEKYKNRLSSEDEAIKMQYLNSDLNLQL